MKEKEALRLLKDALGKALKGTVLEAEAFKMAEKSNLDDLQVKLKLLEAKEFMLAAQIMVNEKIEPLLSSLFSDFSKGIARDFDLLRNQITSLCIELMYTKPEERNSFIRTKESAKNHAATLVDRLSKELEE